MSGIKHSENESSNFKWEGSFTVEATLVMLVVLGVVFVILTTGFYLHDRCVLAGNAYEAAVWGAHETRLDNLTVSVAEAAQILCEGNTIWCSEVQASGQSNSGETTVKLTGRGNIPGISVLNRLIRRQKLAVAVNQTCPSPDRESIIRMSREVLHAGRLGR